MTDPWGPPASMFIGSETVELCLIFAVRSERKFEIHLIRFIGKFNVNTLKRRPSCRRVSVCP